MIWFIVLLQDCDLADHESHLDESCTSGKDDGSFHSPAADHESNKDFEGSPHSLAPDHECASSKDCDGSSHSPATSSSMSSTPSVHLSSELYDNSDSDSIFSISPPESVSTPEPACPKSVSENESEYVTKHLKQVIVHYFSSLFPC